MTDLFHHKKLIETISEEQSFSKAAKKLYIPQPSLSVIVRKIEEDIGMPLFDRTTKPIRLTDAGREYLRTANEIKLSERAFENYIDAINNLQNGYLRIGTNQMLSDLVMPAFLSVFMKEYDKIRIELLNADSTTLETQLMEGKLDLVIDNHPLDKNIFDQRELYHESILLAVPAAMRRPELEGQCMTAEEAANLSKSDKKPVDLKVFRDDPFILLTKGNETRQLTDNLCKQAGFIPNILLEVDRLTTIYRYTAIGAGISFISDTLLRYINWMPESIVYYRLPEKVSTRPVYISYKHSRYYSRAMELINEQLDEWFQNI